MYLYFMDASKAFDCVHYWLLCDKLLKCGMPKFIVQLLFTYLKNLLLSGLIYFLTHLFCLPGFCKHLELLFTRAKGASLNIFQG
jgi:hypothetical protein